MRIDEEFKCIGYYGFGSGASLARGGNGNFCNGCLVRQACWEIHKDRVRKYFPELAAIIDKLGSEPDSQKKIMEFIKEHKVEPYSAVMASNVTDGSLIAHGLAPKDRGEMTLKYPFTV
jgi:hypothetical protein